MGVAYRTAVITATAGLVSHRRAKVSAMCGRYALRRDLDDLVSEFEVDDDTLSGSEQVVTLSTNVAPTTTPPVVLERFRKDEEDAPPTRSLRALRWGLVPSWSKDATGGARMVNARAESLLSKPAFAKAFATLDSVRVGPRPIRVGSPTDRAISSRTACAVATSPRPVDSTGRRAWTLMPALYQPMRVLTANV